MFLRASLLLAPSANARDSDCWKRRQHDSFYKELQIQTTPTGLVLREGSASLASSTVVVRFSASGISVHVTCGAAAIIDPE